MPDPLSQLLASRGWLMADGATGTNLFNMGLASNVAPEEDLATWITPYDLSSVPP